MLAEAMLKSDMPEYRKAGVRLVMKSKAVKKQLNEIVTTYADPSMGDNKEKAMLPTRVDACNLLSRIENEIKEFISSHPLPVENIGGTE